MIAFKNFPGPLFFVTAVDGGSDDKDFAPPLDLLLEPGGAFFEAIRVQDPGFDRQSVFWFSGETADGDLAEKTKGEAAGNWGSGQVD